MITNIIHISMLTISEKVIHLTYFGNKIGTYPDGTLLNNILNDIWPIILRYGSQLFGIGNKHAEYPGYDLVTKEQIDDEKFKEVFITHYNSVGGIITLDYISNKWLYCQFPTTILFDNCYVFND